jgi:hypothetical protein
VPQPGIGSKNFTIAGVSDPLTEKFETLSLKPTKANISMKLVALA